MRKSIFLRRSNILTAIASVTFGLLISPVFEHLTDPLFSTPIKALLAGFTFLSFILIVSTVIISTFAYHYDEQLENFETGLFSLKEHVNLGTTLKSVGIAGASDKRELYDEFWESPKEEMRILQTYLGDLQQLSPNIFSAVKRGVKFKLLLLDPNGVMIHQRLLDIGLSSKAIKVHKDSMERLRILIQQSNPPRECFEVRIYNNIPPFVMYMADDRIWFGCYWQGIHSSQGPHILVEGKHSPLYESLTRTYDEIWKSAKAVDFAGAR